MMHRAVLFLIGVLTSVSFLPAFTDLKQPVAPRKPVTQHYHGTEVVDPYQWLEAMDTREVRTWAMEQDAYARRWNQAVPTRDALRARLKTINDVDRLGSATLIGDRLFFAKSRPDSGMLGIWMQDGTNEPRRLPADRFPEGHTLKGFVPSPNGNFLAYYHGHPAGRWVTVNILDIATGKHLPDQLTGLNTRVSTIHWSRDNQSFFYERYQTPKPGAEQTETFTFLGFYRHQLRGPQNRDSRIQTPTPSDRAYAAKTLAGEQRYLVVLYREDQKHRFLVADARRPDTPARPLFTIDQNTVYLGDWQGRLYFRTHHAAPLGRVVAVDPQQPQPEHWRDVVAEGEHSLVGAALEQGVVLLSYREHARPVLRLQRINGTQRRVALPNGGLFALQPGRFGDGTATVSVSSLIEPGTIYRIDLNTAKITVAARANWTLDPNDFTIDQTFYQSYDGTKIPMFIVAKRNLPKNQPAPMLLYGYGAGNWSAYPWYQPHLVAWLEIGGRYAIPGIRGGGEYGQPWHQAGIKHNKTNSINDFLAAIKYVVDAGYTTPRQLAVNGGSASGPLVAAALIQQPRSFGACLIEWPMIDMLRFKDYPGGKYWVWGNGDPDNAADFAVLYRWSPYHNLGQTQCFPPTMLLLGEKDESTAASHGYKFQAALQHAQRCEAPILTRIIWDGGHYQYGNNNHQTLDSWTDVLCFLIRTLDLNPKIPGNKAS
ncbi:prolyl oligopeptidase family serine peptidase [Acanthopleuribacter pedis]|uniref:prolyl oligopeptidase n=1 Tax=Acanthopleuribacter pedis TaxID=442870 RepID=A0A8J7QG85_9BACT|nr:prolyl oligopeptidase family serine peptidase [Acanthopleuribacter pedis]MBO1318053.1 S9 family peptidase [Acanthopleuribacter pedis]